MKKIALTFLFALGLSQSEALLPPLYQTAGEIKAILSDEQLGETLHSGAVIEKIVKNEEGYEITTNKAQVQVRVVYESQQTPGPARYKIVFETPTSVDRR